MVARRGNLERPFCVLLAFHVSEVGIARRLAGPLVAVAVQPRALVGCREVGAHLQQRVGWIDGGVHHQRRLVGIGPRQDECSPVVAATAPDGKGHRQRAANRTQLSGKRQLSRELVAVQLLGRDLAGRGQDTERDGQIEAARFLRQVSRRQVDGDAARRHLEAYVLQGGADPVFCLAHLGVGQADNR
jgi:hypothetical protein